jgi:putative Mg2+ transporter-C (MgtC) family protein
MSLELSWTNVAVRLVLTVLVGIVIGYDRSAHGKAAGMRTTVLVCLAASVAMIQANLLLSMAGRPTGSFVMNDLMRLPLGILTGMGFIGGGAILRRGSLVIGVTTAATLWLVTVIGLCIGGGQLELGLAATVLGLFALRVLRWVEARLPQECYAQLELQLDSSRINEEEIRRKLGSAGLSITGTHIAMNGDRSELRTFIFNLRMVRTPRNTQTPDFLQELAGAAGVTKFRWRELQ